MLFDLLEECAYFPDKDTTVPVITALLEVLLSGFYGRFFNESLDPADTCSIASPTRLTGFDIAVARFGTVRFDSQGD
jgi:hypothetical protein